MLKTDRLTVVASLPQSLVHAASEAGLVFSRRQHLMRIEDLAQPRPRSIGKIPWGPREWLSRWRLAERVRRNGIQTALDVPGHGWLAANRAGWWVLGVDGSTRAGPQFPAGRPLARGLCCHDGAVYVGDYHDNPHREPVRIYRSFDLRHFETAWEFPAGAVRHIHALVLDRHRPDLIWVLTGDFDHESRFYATVDGFRSLRPVLALGQFTRAVDLACIADAIVWGMDSPLEASYILRLRRGADHPCIEARLPGPAYYMTSNAAGALYVGTTVESGPAVADRRARVFGSRPDGTWEEVASFAKDRFPQYGMIHLPRGCLPENYLAFSSRALVPGEGRLIIARDLAWA